MISIYGIDGVIKSVFYGPAGVLPYMEKNDRYIEGFGEPGVDFVNEGVICKGLKSRANLILEVRTQRDRKLTESDWVIIKAQETNTLVSAEWLTYRQALRDVTLQEGYPTQVVWPSTP